MNRKFIYVIVAAILLSVWLTSILIFKSNYQDVIINKLNNIEDIWIEKKEFENKQVFCFYKLKIEGKYYYMVHKDNSPQYATLIRIEEQK